MIDHLAGRLVEFPGAPNHARCFANILNLVIKSIMQQFDMPKKRWNDVTDKGDELMGLAGDIEAKEHETQVEREESQEGPDDEPSQDNTEGWVDERDGMAEEDLVDLDESVWPIRFLLTKVSENMQVLYSIS
jgi:hypothetical protein